MKHDWEYKKLGEVGTINYGTRIVRKNTSGSKYYVYGGGGPTFMTDDYNREDCFIVSRFAMSPQCTRFVKGRFFLNDSGLSVKTNTDTLKQIYLDKVLLANNDNIYSLGKGAAQKNLDITAFQKLSIPIPPLPIQQQIVDELDKLSEIIEKKKQQVKELDILAQSIFYDMFGDPVENEKGWDVKKLENLCDGIGDGLHGTPNYDPFGEVAFINGNNLVDGRIVLNEKTQYVNQSEAKKIFISLNTNTVLLSINGTLGKTAIYNNENVVLGKSACYCRLKSELTPLFVLTLMNTHAFVSYLEDNSSKSTIKNVGLKSIRNYPMILPPLPLQQSFAQKIEAIEKQKELINQSIKETQTLFDSRMDYYFGE